MKKFIIACTAVIIAVTCWMFVSDRIGSTLSFNMNKEVKTFTTVSDKEILVDTGNGMEPFEIRGVDMGVGIPGHFATDYAIDKETYLRWFRMIKDMGANCVRVYTLLQDDFYDAVWEFNHDNPDPLYIIHGVWIDDYVLYSHRDAYSKDFLNEFLRDSRILVDMIHGNKRFSLGEDLGSGSYTKDISPWVLGYILGVEWEDTTVAFTDHMQEERDSYEGKYMRTTEEALKAIDELNKNYALVITTNSGLWRYLIGDTIRFTSLNPYRVKVSGRTKHHINVFGEELMVENTDVAIAKTCAMFDCEIVDYTVAPIFMSDKQKGAHEWIIEFKNPPENIEKFGLVLDENIQALNSDYEAKRYNNMTLNPLVLNVARTNLFYDWLKKEDKLGGQHKIPRLSNERNYLESLLNL